MPADANAFRDLAYALLAAASVGGAAARVTRQPVIAGYLLDGILLSPFTPGPVVFALHTLELFAEIGVSLPRFFIDAEFSLRELLLQDTCRSQRPPPALLSSHSWPRVVRAPDNGGPRRLSRLTTPRHLVYPCTPTVRVGNHKLPPPRRAAFVRSVRREQEGCPSWL